jgi:hypothetical protein
MPLVSNTVCVNALLEETWSRYDVAPVDAFQVNVGFTGTPVAPSTGETSVGGRGGGTAEVVKLHVLENGPGPPGFSPYTRQ